MSKRNSSLSPVAKGAGPASAAKATGPVTPVGTACPAKNRRALRIGLWVLAALILVILGAAFWYTNALVTQMVWVHIPPSKAAPADLGLAAENVHFRTVDGLRISAWFVPAKPAAAQAGRVRGTVILVHGWGGDLGTKGDLLGFHPARHERHRGFRGSGA